MEIPDVYKRQVKRIVGLTGTPSSNGLMDLWAEFRVLDMGRRLGRFITRYRSAYFQPDKRNAQVVFSYKPLPGAEDAIYERISDITISMRAGDYLDVYKRQAEGTAAHALAEHKLKKALKLRSRKPVSPYDCDEMDAYTDGYVEFVLEQLEEARALCADPLVLIEQRLDFSCYVPDGFGTGDCLIVADKLLHIIDFKYGQGVLVDAEENPQMMLYALGALRQFDHLYDLSLIHI